MINLIKSHNEEFNRRFKNDKNLFYGCPNVCNVGLLYKLKIKLKFAVLKTSYIEQIIKNTAFGK